MACVAKHIKTRRKFQQKHMLFPHNNTISIKYYLGANIGKQKAEKQSYRQDITLCNSLSNDFKTAQIYQKAKLVANNIAIIYPIK